jgi:hypothetical protein
VMAPDSVSVYYHRKLLWLLTTIASPYIRLEADRLPEVT